MPPVNPPLPCTLPDLELPPPPPPPPLAEDSDNQAIAASPLSPVRGDSIITPADVSHLQLLIPRHGCPNVDELKRSIDCSGADARVDADSTDVVEAEAGGTDSSGPQRHASRRRSMAQVGAAAEPPKEATTNKANEKAKAIPEVYEMEEGEIVSLDSPEEKDAKPEKRLMSKARRFDCVWDKCKERLELR